MNNNLTIRAFQPRDQDAAAGLIRANLKARFGVLDEDKNPDLRDLRGHYLDDQLLLAFIGKELVGTGALTIVDAGIARIERMHVAANARRRGVARRLLAELEALAVARGVQSIVLETTIGWDDAARFYRSQAYRETHRIRDEVHFEKRIA